MSSDSVEDVNFVRGLSFKVRRGLGFGGYIRIICLLLNKKKEKIEKKIFFEKKFLLSRKLFNRISQNSIKDKGPL